MSAFDATDKEVIEAQARRIADLEKLLSEAGDLARIAERELRAILAGCGSLDEQLRAGIPMAKLIGHLRACVRPPSEEQIEQSITEPLPSNVRLLRPERKP